MLKRIIAICLLVALISSNFSRFFIYAGFELNQKYIAENLCINKNKPWMHCNGKCFFMRKIKEAQDNEKKQDRADQQNHYQEALPVTQPVSTIAFATRSLKTAYPNTATPETIQRAYSILLPPKVV
jgi:hypothetical protein